MSERSHEGRRFDWKGATVANCAGQEAAYNSPAISLNLCLTWNILEK